MGEDDQAESSDEIPRSRDNDDFGERAVTNCCVEEKPQQDVERRNDDVVEWPEGQQESDDIGDSDAAPDSVDALEEKRHETHERTPDDTTRELGYDRSVNDLLGDGTQLARRPRGEHARDGEDESEEKTTDEIKEKSEGPQTEDRCDQPRIGSFGRSRDWIGEVLVEEFCPADDEEDEGDPEGESARDLTHLTETGFDQRVDDTECNEAEDDREPRDETRRNELERRLIEPPSAFLGSPVEYLRGSWGSSHGSDLTRKRDRCVP